MVVEKLWFQNIKMKNITYDAIIINTNYGAWMANKNGKAYPTFRDISFKNINCDDAKTAIDIVGTSQKPIENITMENVSIKASTGMQFEWVQDLELIDVVSKPSNGKAKVFIQCSNVFED